MADEVTQYNDFWSAFSDGTSYTAFEEECNAPDNLTEHIMESYGLSHTVLPGTSLPNLDIKQMDAYQVAKLSMMHASSQDGKFYELTVNEEGEITYYTLGEDTVTSVIDKYYEIHSSEYKEECTGVLVTGAKPLVERYKADFKSIWAENKVKVYTTSWMGSNCMSDNYSQFATIVFNDPHLETGWEDGIDNFYEQKSPWENLIGYARYIDWPNSSTSKDTTVQRTSQATIPIVVSSTDGDGYKADLGKELTPRPALTELKGVDTECFSNVAGPKANFENGVLIPIEEEGFRYETIRGTTIDKLIKVDSVYVIGRTIDKVMGIPKNDEAAQKANPESTDADLLVTISESQDSVIKLKAGEHYQLAVDNENETIYVPPKVYIVFADSSRSGDPAKFGTSVAFKIDKTCPFYKEVKVEGYTGSILPTGGTKGILVKQVFALVDLNTPSIVVQDPRINDPGGPMAKQIADKLEYKLAPLLSYEPPAPVAFAGPGYTSGKIIGMEDLETDSDPTEVQDFSESEYEQIISLMATGGGGMTLNFSFIENDAELVRMASLIYEQMSQGTGVSTTYICGPDSTPKLGMKGEDDATVVNSISYSYTDSSSYTISVNCGPRQIGNLAQIGGTPVYKATEDINAKGRVLEDYGDHIHFKVLIEGMSKPVRAINTAPSIIRVGDKVQVSLHNNPVEA
jgi:hypothetical protein